LGKGAVIGDKEVLENKKSSYQIKCISETGEIICITADNFISRMKSD